MKPLLYRTVQSLFHPYKKDGWEFSEFRKNLYRTESLEWSRYYLPISVKGLTVLDVGAGEGETARFFLEHGAAKVICIELDLESFRLLKQNSLGRSMEVYNKPFDLCDLSLPFDFMKMDIEGYEEELLKLPVKLGKPSVIEVHGLQLKERFLKAGYRLAVEDTYQSRHGWFCYMYS